MGDSDRRGDHHADNGEEVARSGLDLHLPRLPSQVACLHDIPLVVTCDLLGVLES